MNFLKIYFSPFKPPRLKWYVGKVAIGTPYFFPRRWIGLKAVPKKIGFDFVGLGWKTKWRSDDYRMEWDPVFSFVFFDWQIALKFLAPSDECDPHYWECWLFYERETDKYSSTKERIQQARKGFPCVWIRGDEEKVCYWDLILKNKYL